MNKSEFITYKAYEYGIPASVLYKYARILELNTISIDSYNKTNNELFKDYMKFREAFYDKKER